MANKNEIPIPFDKLSRPAQQALKAADYTSLNQLAQVREREIAQLHGLGPKTIRILRAVLAEHDMSFAQD